MGKKETLVGEWGEVVYGSLQYCEYCCRMSKTVVINSDSSWLVLMWRGGCSI